MSRTLPSVFVVTLADALDAISSSFSSGADEWPKDLWWQQPHRSDEGSAENLFRRGQQMSVTDKVMLDIVSLALSDVVVLNRYSTFSQSVIDERVLTAISTLSGPDAATEFKTLPNLKTVNWW